MITTDTQNGRAKGRTAPPLPTHTFHDSGVTVKLHKLSPMTSQEIQAQVKREMRDEEPIPPIAEVDYGQGKVQEPNRLHPVYVERLKTWEAAVNSEANERLFRLACLDAVELTITDEVRAQIARKKRSLRIVAKVEWDDDPELDQDENDQIFYITHIACSSPEDLKEFYQAVATRSQPTEAAVEAYKESFPGDVPASEHLEL
jgi:hypothetical protein